jgi:predicted Rossmann fold flavoprotein
MSEPGVIIVGGGPAGLMAAGQAASCGVETVLLEKMDQPGRKLRITGKGRCNLTNLAPIDKFITHFNPDGRFLYSAFSRFFTDDLLAFFEELGVETVTERGGRVFPTTNDAQAVVNALTRWCERQGVSIQARSKVENLLIDQDRVVGVLVSPFPKGGLKKEAPSKSVTKEFISTSVIIATGGASYPGTGSTGDGYRMAESCGHTITPIRPALVPLETSGNIAARLRGLSLRNVNVSIIVDGQLESQAFGEMLFTHFGLSGPIILTLSRQVVDALADHREVQVSIDLKPALDETKLDARLRRDFDSHGKRQYQTLLKGLLPRKLIPVCIELTNIPPDKQAHQITSLERKRLLSWLKDFRFRITRPRPFSQAIITAGGVSTREIDPRSMASRLIKGLYFAGEILDLDANTGGYNLQSAFSTGWLAGRSAAEYCHTADT